MGTASRLSCGSADGPFGTDQDFSTPSTSSRKSKCVVLASWICTTKRGASPAAPSRPRGSSVLSKSRLSRYVPQCVLGRHVRLLPSARADGGRRGRRPSRKPRVPRTDRGDSGSREADAEDVQDAVDAEEHDRRAADGECHRQSRAAPETPLDAGGPQPPGPGGPADVAAQRRVADGQGVRPARPCLRWRNRRSEPVGRRRSCHRRTGRHPRQRPARDLAAHGLFLQSGRGRSGVRRTATSTALRSPPPTHLAGGVLEVVADALGGAVRVSSGVSSQPRDIETFLTFVRNSYRDRVPGAAGLEARSGC